MSRPRQVTAPALACWVRCRHCGHKVEFYQIETDTIGLNGKPISFWHDSEKPIEQMREHRETHHPGHLFDVWEAHYPEERK